MKNFLLCAVLLVSPLMAMEDEELQENQTGVSQICELVANYYFHGDHTTSRTLIMEELSIRLKRSSRRPTLENIFLGINDGSESPESSTSSNRSDSPLPLQREENDTPDITEAKEVLHRMVMDSFEESLRKKDDEIDTCRHDISNNRLKFRLAMVAAGASAFTTIASTTATIIIALTQ